MVRHNNVVSNGHFHKNWQESVKLWFRQPFRKVKRANNRRRKLLKSLPKPVEKLRPIVHCPTVRYNRKIRQGRGFTLDELRRAGIHRKFGPTIGVSIDYRRRNKSYEAQNANVKRLKEYRNNLILFPVKETVAMTDGRDLNKFRVVEKLEVRKVTEDDRKSCPFPVRRRKRSTKPKNYME